jgi:hypothetical protein
MRTGGPPPPEEEAAGGAEDEQGRIAASGGSQHREGREAARPPRGGPADADEDGPPAARGTNDGPCGPCEPCRPRRVNEWWVIVIGTLLLFAFGVVLIASLVNLWPAIESFTNTTTTSATKSAASTPSSHYTVRLLLGAVKVKTTAGTSLLLVVAISGALGSTIHTSTSFADFVGNRRLFKSWVTWYLLRPVIGAALAVLIYFALRGGFFSGTLQSGDVNPYGIAALGGLAGMFSQQAADKLKEVFETLFQVSEGAGDAQRKDDLANAAPVIKKLEPDSVPLDSPSAKLKITGENFVKSSVAHIDGEAQPTSYVSPQLLEVTVPGELLKKEGALTVTVVTGSPGGGESQPIPLSVLP